MADALGRWSAGQDDAPAELKGLLTSAHADLPSRAQLAHVEQALAPLLGPPGATLPMTAPKGLGTIKVAATVAVGVGLVAAGAWLATRSEKAPTPAERQPAAESARTKPPAPARELVTPSATAPSGPSATTPGVEGAPSASEVAPEPTHAAVEPKPAQKKPSEAQLLDRAQAALKTDPKRALALTRQHKRLYPNGALSQEREVIAIEALSRLDKKSDAEKRADRFGKKYPDSAHQEKVRTTIDDD